MPPCHVIEQSPLRRAEYGVLVVQLPTGYTEKQVLLAQVLTRWTIIVVATLRYSVSAVQNVCILVQTEYSVRSRG